MAVCIQRKSEQWFGREGPIAAFRAIHSPLSAGEQQRKNCPRVKCLRGGGGCENYFPEREKEGGCEEAWFWHGPLREVRPPKRPRRSGLKAQGILQFILRYPDTEGCTPLTTTVEGDDIVKIVGHSFNATNFHITFVPNHVSKVKCPKLYSASRIKREIRKIQLESMYMELMNEQNQSAGQREMRIRA
jgi:hypothetical protein